MDNDDIDETVRMRMLICVSSSASILYSATMTGR